MSRNSILCAGLTVSLLAVTVSNRAEAVEDDREVVVHEHRPLRDWAAPRSRLAWEGEMLQVTELRVQSDTGFTANPDVDFLIGGGGISYAHKLNPNVALLVKTSLFTPQRDTPDWQDDEPLSAILRQTFGAEASWQWPFWEALGVEWTIGAAVGPSLHVFEDLRAVGMSVEARTSFIVWAGWLGYGLGAVFHYDHAKAYRTSGWNKDALKDSRLDLISGNALGLIAYRF